MGGFDSKRLPTNCGSEGILTYHIFIHFNGNVLFLTQRIVWEDLTQKVTIVYFLDTLKL